MHKDNHCIHSVIIYLIMLSLSKPYTMSVAFCLIRMLDAVVTFFHNNTSYMSVKHSKPYCGICNERISTNHFTHNKNSYLVIRKQNIKIAAAYRHLRKVSWNFINFESFYCACSKCDLYTTLRILCEIDFNGHIGSSPLFEQVSIYIVLSLVYSLISM